MAHRFYVLVFVLSILILFSCFTMIIAADHYFHASRWLLQQITIFMLHDDYCSRSLFSCFTMIIAADHYFHASLWLLQQITIFMLHDYCSRSLFSCSMIIIAADHYFHASRWLLQQITIFMLHDHCSRSLSPLPYFQIGVCVCVCVCVRVCVCGGGGTIFFYFVKLLSLKIPAQEPSPIACDNKQGSLFCCTGPHRNLYKPDLMEKGKIWPWGRG